MVVPALKASITDFFGSKTSYAVLDVDKDSDYLELIPTIQGALETIGINKTVLLRSSQSGGVHIYIPFPQAYPTFSVACALKQCLEAQGFAIAPGQLEVFPNEKPYGKSWRGEFYEYNGHRLPLQPHTGSCLLKDDLEPCGDGLALFWAMWDNAVQWNPHEEIAEALVVARANRRRRRHAATGPAAQWKADLEAIIADGWTGPGQTNQLLKEIATYGRVFEKLSGADLQVYVFTTAKSRPGYERWCDHQHEIARRCDAWSLAVEKYYWPLGDEPIRERKPFKDICQQRADDARARIIAAMRSLRFDAPQMGIKKLANELVVIAKCSLTTLYKYAELWHPKPKRGQQPVTSHSTGDTEDLATVQRLVRESLESVGIRAVTHKGGENEVCSLKSSNQKNSVPAGAREGCGERKGNSTGWIPNLNWKPGAVGEV